MDVKIVKVPEKTMFEDALNATGFGTFNYLQLLLCSVLVMSLVGECFAVSYLVVGSACEFQTTSVEQGLMAAVPLIGIIFTSHIWGYLADTQGRKKILFISVAMAFIFGVLSAFSPNWILFCVLKLLSSSSISGTFALANTLLSECTPESYRNTLIILVNSIFVLMPGVMAVITIPVLPLTFSYYVPFLGIYWNSWRLLSLIFTCPCALGVLGMYLNCESPKYLLSVGRDQEAVEVLKTIFMLNKKKPKEDFKVTSLVLDEDKSSGSQGLWSSMKSQTIPLLTPPLLKSTLVISACMICLYFCVNTLMVWLPTIADSLMKAVANGQGDLTLCQMISSNRPDVNATLIVSQSCTLEPTAMYLVFANAALYSSLNVLLTVVVNYVGRKKIIIGIELLSAMCGLAIVFVQGWVMSSILFIVYLCPLLLVGLITSYTVDIYPTYLRAMAVCLSVMLGRVGAVIGINVLKQMIFSQCEESFYLFAALTFVTIFVACFLPSDKKYSHRKVVA